MMRKLAYIVLSFLMILVVICSSVLYIQYHKISSGLTLEGKVYTNKGINFTHYLDSRENLLQRFDINFLGRQITSVDVIEKEGWLIGIEGLGGYVLLAHDTPSMDKKGLFDAYIYWMTNLTYESGHFVLTIDQDATEDLVKKLTGKSIKTHLNESNDKLDYQHFSGRIEFLESSTKVQLTIDDIEISAEYKDGDQLEYVDKPILKYDSLEPILDWFGDRHEGT